MRLAQQQTPLSGLFKGVMCASIAMGAATLGCASRFPPCVGQGGCERGMTCTVGRCFKNGTEIVPIDAQRIVVAPQEMAVVARGSGDKALPGEISLGGQVRSTPIVLFRFPTPWGRRVRIARAFLTLHPAPGAVPESRPVLVSVARVLEPWSAAEASWGRLPRLSAFEGSAYSGIGPAKALRIDVTSIVQRWALGRSSDQGLALTASSDAPFGSSYATGVSGGTGPRLDVYLR
jgi:hypothetical protein